MRDTVRIVEVGPRDGLQNETEILPVKVRVELIRRLADCGLDCIESGSFVSPKKVPQMADTGAVLKALMPDESRRYPVLVPNLRGLEDALAAGAKEIAVFLAASDKFSQHNINCDMAESLVRTKPVMREAQAAGLKVRGYLSCVLGCPYQGEVPVEAVRRMAGALYEMGCYEISLGDTIGIGTPGKAKGLFEAVAAEVPMQQLAAHFHNTCGQALANLYAVWQCGVRVMDASVGGLGGCPYAPGASGNVATEDVLYMLEGLGVAPPVDLDKLVETSGWVCKLLGRAPRSHLAAAKPPADLRRLERRTSAD